MTPDRPPLAAFRRDRDRPPDWDMTWNMAVETGGWLVSRKAKIERSSTSSSRGQEPDP